MLKIFVIVSTSPLLPICLFQLFALPLGACLHWLAELSIEFFFRISTLKTAVATSFIFWHLH